MTILVACKQLGEVRTPRFGRHLAVGLGNFVTRLSLDRRVGNASREEPDRADSVVVCRDEEVGIVRVAVGVGDGNDGNAEATRLVHRQLFALGIDDEDRRRELGHVPHAAERPFQPLELRHLARCFLLRKLVERTPCQFSLKLFHVAQPVADRDEIRQRSPKPTAIDIVLPGALGFAFNDVLRLLLGADKENLATSGRRVDDKVMRSREEGNSLLQIDDMNAVALGENVRLHLRVPALRLMPEMNACLEQGFERHPGRLPMDAGRDCIH